MKKVTITRDTNYSFIKTTTNSEGESFSRKLEKGDVDYSNACLSFHRNNVDIVTGNSITE